MPDSVTELVQRGLSLPVVERERLVDQLLESLNEPAVQALDTAWNAEIERRLAEYDSGQVQAVEAEEVFAKAARLAR